MKHIILFLALFSSFGTGYCQKKLIKQMVDDDTVTINYSTAFGEVGSIHEKIVLTKLNNEIRATQIVYDFGTSFACDGLIKIKKDSCIFMRVDSIRIFLNSVKHKFAIVKKEWVLTDRQISRLEEFFAEAASFKSKGFSNAPEYYCIRTGREEIMVLDRSGKWDKNQSLKETLELKSLR